MFREAFKKPNVTNIEPPLTLTPPYVTKTTYFFHHIIPFLVSRHRPTLFYGLLNVLLGLWILLPNSSVCSHFNSLFSKYKEE